MSKFYSKSFIRVFPSFSIYSLVLSGYFSLLFGGLMIGVGGVMMYQALRSSNHNKLQETVVTISKQLNTL